MKDMRSLILFILVVMGCGILIGTVTAPGAWYVNLEKPPFNPPNWVFAPVWTVLYGMIAYVGWRVWDGPLRSLWLLQLALNFLWSPVFFEAQMTELALIVVLMLLGTILAFIRRALAYDRVAAILFLPYAAWVAFASLLNGSIAVLN